MKYGGGQRRHRRHHASTDRRDRCGQGALGVVLLVIAAIGAGVVAGVPAGGGPISFAGAESPFAAMPLAAQSNVSAYPVLERLGLWDGTAFQAVGAGSLRADHVVAMSHGWSPGYLETYQQLQAKSPTLVTAWTPGLVNSSKQSMLDTWVPVAQAFQAADPEAAIVLFSWIDQSATGSDPLEVRDPEQATEVNGHRFATALDQALAPGLAARGGQVHLVGHSFGANVATTAALALTVPPRQLTLLDSPETSLTELAGAKNDLRYKLPRLDIGRGPGQTFVDNYISYVGIPYRNFPGLDQVVDVQTAPPPNDSAGDKHSFAIVWYRSSARDLSAGVGFAWSPLLGGDVARLGAFYRQPDPTRVLALDEVNGPPTPGVHTQLLVSTASLDVPGRGSGGTGHPGSTAPGPQAANQPAAAAIDVRGSGPSTWNLTFTTDNDSLWLDVDLALRGAPGDLVSLFVDGRQRYQAAVPAAGTGAAGSFLILYDVTPGEHVLSVALSGPSSTEAPSPTTVATVSAMRMSSTGNIQRNFAPAETNRVIFLLLAGVLVVIALAITVVVFLIRRKRGSHPAAGTAGQDPIDEPA